MDTHGYCDCVDCLDAEAAELIDAWIADGCPLADGTHAHAGADVAECEAKRDAERKDQLRAVGLWP